MPSLPYMQLYIADYLADTMHLDCTESGAYLHLLMNYWQTGKPLPDDDKKLAMTAKCPVDDWLNVRCVLVEFFVNENGTWTHKRVETDLQKVRNKSRQASEAGKKSAQKRQQKQMPATDVEFPLNGKATIEDKDKDKDSRKNIVSLAPDDDWPLMIWNNYPHPANRGDRKKTLISLGKIPIRERQAVLDGLTNLASYKLIATWQKSPMLATWVNQERWKQPIDLVQAKAENATTQNAPTRQEKREQIARGIPEKYRPGNRATDSDTGRSDSGEVPPRLAVRA